MYERNHAKKLLKFETLGVLSLICAIARHPFVLSVKRFSRLTCWLRRPQKTRRPTACLESAGDSQVIGWYQRPGKEHQTNSQRVETDISWRTQSSRSHSLWRFPGRKKNIRQNNKEQTKKNKSRQVQNKTVQNTFWTKSGQKINWWHVWKWQPRLLLDMIFFVSWVCAVSEMKRKDHAVLGLAGNSWRHGSGSKLWYQIELDFNKMYHCINLNSPETGRPSNSQLVWWKTFEPLFLYNLIYIS